MERFDYTILPEEDPAQKTLSEARQKFFRLVWFVTGKAKSPTLSQSRERDLVQLAKEGSSAASEELTRRFSPFLDAISRRFTTLFNAAELHEDVFSTALTEFQETIQNADFEAHDNRLSTYARIRVTSAVMKYLSDNRKIVAHSKSVMEKKAFYQRTSLVKNFREVHGRPPRNDPQDFQLLSEMSGLNPRAISRAFNSSNIRSIPFHRIEMSSNIPCAEDDLCKRQGADLLHARIEALGQNLRPRDLSILRAYANDLDVKAEDLGREHGITPERVRQILRENLKALREDFSSRGITSLDQVA